MLPSPEARALVEGHPRLSDDSRANALRLFVPAQGDADLLTPFVLGVAADPNEEDLVRIEAIRLLEIVPMRDDALAAGARNALIALAQQDEDWDVRNAAGCAVFSLPGADREILRMRELIAAEEEDFVRENVDAALQLMLNRSR